MGHLTDARTAVQAVLTRIQADWTAYDLVLELDNRKIVDQSKQQDPYLCVKIVSLDGEQADLSHRPLVVQYGQILLAVKCRAGTGSTKATELLDFVLPYFNLKVIGPVHCHAAQATEAKEIDGWWTVPGLVSYWYHYLS